MFDEVYSGSRLFRRISENLYEEVKENSDGDHDILHTVEIDGMLYERNEDGTPSYLIAVSPEKNGVIYFADGSRNPIGSDEHVFDGCTGITEIHVPSSWNENTFFYSQLATPVKIFNDYNDRISGRINPNVIPVFPHVLLSKISNIDMKIAFACGYLSTPTAFEPAPAKRYEKWIAANANSIIYYCKKCGYTELLEAMDERGFRLDPLMPDDPDFVKKLAESNNRETNIRTIMLGYADALAKAKIVNTECLALIAKYAGSETLSLFEKILPESNLDLLFFIQEVFGWKEICIYDDLKNHYFLHYETVAACEKARTVPKEDRLKSLQIIMSCSAPFTSPNEATKDAALKLAIRENNLPLVRYLLSKNFMLKQSRLDGIAANPNKNDPDAYPEVQIYSDAFATTDGIICLGETVCAADPDNRIYLYPRLCRECNLSSVDKLTAVLKYAAHDSLKNLDPTKLLEGICNEHDAAACRIAHENGLLKGAFYLPFVDYFKAIEDTEFSNLLTQYWAEEGTEDMQRQQKWYYRSSSDDVMLLRCLQTTPVVTIPDSFDGVPVRYFSTAAFDLKPSLSYSCFYLSDTAKLPTVVALYCPTARSQFLVNEAHFPFLLLNPDDRHTTFSQNSNTIWSCTNENGITENELLWVKLKNDTAVILKYLGHDAHVSIPATINGVAVTGIAQHAFENSSVQTVDLPKTITNIGVSAFQGSQLTSFAFCGDECTIDDNAFGSCPCLISAEIHVTTLRMYQAIFTHCPVLSTLILDATIQHPLHLKIEAVYSRCPALVNIQTPNDEVAQ